MNTAFYNRMAQTALRLLADKGDTVKLERFSGGVINPVTGEKSEIVDISKNTTGVLLNYTKDEIDGTLILSTDRKLLIDASIRPLKTDKPIFNTEYIGSIVHIKEVNPAGIPIVYFLQVRK